MRIHIELTEGPDRFRDVVEGNVYAHRGGRGSKYGHMHIVLAISEDRMAACLTVDKLGNIIGATNYLVHYFEDKVPIAFVEGLEDIDLTMRSL